MTKANLPANELDELKELLHDYGTKEGKTSESLKMAFHAFEVGRGMAIAALNQNLSEGME